MRQGKGHWTKRIIIEVNLKNVFKSIKSVLYNLKYIALIKLKENAAASLFFFILLSVVLPFSSWSFGSSENY